MLSALIIIGLACALITIYLLSDLFKSIRRLKVDFQGPGLGEALNVKGSNMNWSTVKITFSTTQPNGMLYLNYGPIVKGVGPGGGDIDPYLVIYLREGYLYTNVNSETFVDEQLSDQPLADGKKHTVELSIDTSNSRVTTKVDKEDALTHLFQSGNEPLGTQVLIGFVNKNVRSLYGAEDYYFKPFKGCFYQFELYGQDKLLLDLENLVYGGQVKKVFYNE